jgi:hypothetical protein
VYPDPAVVGNKAKLAEPIHEEADSGARGPYHIRQSLLCDRRDQRFWFTRLPVLRHQQENPSQTLFAGVEKLINQISLGLPSGAPDGQEANASDANRDPGNASPAAARTCAHRRRLVASCGGRLLPLPCRAYESVSIGWLPHRSLSRLAACAEAA